MVITLVLNSLELPATRNNTIWQYDEIDNGDESHCARLMGSVRPSIRVYNNN